MVLGGWGGKGGGNHSLLTDNWQILSKEGGKSQKIMHYELFSDLCEKHRKTPAPPGNPNM